MKVGEETKIMLQIIGMILGLTAFCGGVGLLADGLQSSVGIGAAVAVITAAPMLLLLAIALYFDNRGEQ